MKAPIENADFGKTAADYLRHRAGFPDSLFTRLFDAGNVHAGQQLADIGTGTGTLARGFAQRQCHVTGIDPAAEMLLAAESIDSASKTPNPVNYRIGTAENTGLENAAFDVVTAGQCWHWFDGVLAAVEMRRILKPTGRLIVAYYDWLPLNRNVVRRTEELIEQYNPAWKGGNQNGMHPSLLRTLGETGYSEITSFSYDEPAVYTHEGWRGRIRASAGVAATLDDKTVREFDAELTELLKREFPAEPLAVPHRVFVVVSRP